VSETTRNTFNAVAYVKAQIDQHAGVLERIRDSLTTPFGDLIQACGASLRGGGKLLFFGNGGSAADAQHIATELSVRYIGDREPLAALALTTDTSMLTAAGNDYGFEQIFARQIEALGNPGDVAVGISTSGKSPNVLLALKRAAASGLVTAVLTGSSGGDLARQVDHCIIVPSNTTARIQEMHTLIGHMLCGAIEIELGLVDR
jgi:D-sedoheptulose 7-phosphate isomerase